ncbi:MAG: hypothetical protein R2750_03570 [Bacteroidales bacterium]
MMLRQISVFFIFLATVSVFWFSMIPKNLVLAMSAAMILLMLVVILIGLIYDRSARFKQHFSTEIMLIFLALMFSSFGAKWAHNQDFPLTMWAQKGMFFYLFYFFLHTIRISPKEIERLMLFIAILYLIGFILQTVAYPRVFFDARMSWDRGTLRLFLPGKAFVVVMYFYFLQLFFEKTKPKYLIFCLLTFVVTLLQGTRSALFLLLLGTLFNLIFSKRVKSRFLIMFLLMLSIFPIFFIFQDIFMNLVAVSEEQSEDSENDIRVRAAIFFLTDFYHDKLNYFIGHGESHMASPYGMQIFYYKVNNGFFLSDIGIIGEYVRFGVLYVISIALILRKLFVLRIDPKYMYFKYYILISLIGMVMGGIFSREDSFVPILAMMYFIDVSIHDKKLAAEGNP